MMIHFRTRRDPNHRLLQLGFILLGVVSSLSFLTYNLDTANSFGLAASGLMTTIILASMATHTLHYTMHTGSYRLHIAALLMLPWMDIFRITLFGLTFSLEAILFYFLFLKLGAYHQVFDPGKSVTIGLERQAP